MCKICIMANKSSDYMFLKYRTLFSNFVYPKRGLLHLCFNGPYVHFWFDSKIIRFCSLFVWSYSPLKGASVPFSCKFQNKNLNVTNCEFFNLLSKNILWFFFARFKYLKKKKKKKCKKLYSIFFFSIPLLCNGTGSHYALRNENNSHETLKK